MNRISMICLRITDCEKIRAIPTAIRVVAFIVATPLLAITIELYRHYAKRPHVGAIPALVPMVLIIAALTPGLYIPPYYGGIAGWTMEVDREKPIDVTGYKLVNDIGQEIWLNHAFLQPHTQNGRFRRAYLNSGRSESDYMGFLFSNYVRIYPMLERGRLPHQYALGTFAYPPHNLSDNNALDYVGDFSPERIVAIRRVSEYYDWNGERIGSKTLLSREVRPPQN